MSSTKSVINPEAMARLRKDTKFAMSAKKAVNQFNNFSGPPGRYFARLQRLDFRFHKTGGHPCFTFYHTCLAKCPDVGSDTNILDQQHAGLAMKVYREVKVTEKMTQQDAWDAAMVDLQAYDIKTRNFGVRNGIEVQDNGETFWKDLGDALDALQDRRPAVIIDVSEGKPQPGKTARNFVNVRETVAEEIVSRLASPQMDISDDEMEVPDEEADGEAAASETEPTLDDQITQILALNRDQLIQALSAQAVNYDWASLTLENVQSIAVAFLRDEPLPSPESFSSSAPREKVVLTSSDVGTLPSGFASDSCALPSGPVITDHDADLVEPASNDDEEEGEDSDDEEEELPVTDLLMKLQHTVANENRDQLKARLRSMGALLPETKFKKADVQSDEFLRNWIIDVYTGKTAPVMVDVASEEIPF